MRKLGMYRIVALLVGIDVVLFGGAGLVGNHRSGWRGPAGDALWSGALLAVAATLAALAFVSAALVRSRQKVAA